MRHGNIIPQGQDKPSSGKRALTRIAVLLVLCGAGFLVVSTHKQKMYAKHHIKAVSEALREESVQVAVGTGLHVSFKGQSECFAGDLDIMSWASKFSGNENLLFAIERMDASTDSSLVYSRIVSLQNIKQGLTVHIDRNHLPRSGLLGVFLCSDSRSNEGRCFGKDVANMNKLSRLYGAAHPLVGNPLEDAASKAQLNKDQIFYFNRIVLRGSKAVLKTADFRDSESDILKAATLQRDGGLSEATATSYREYLDQGAKASSSMPMVSEQASKGQVAVVLPYFDQERCKAPIQQQLPLFPKG